MSGWYSHTGLAPSKDALLHVLARKANLSFELFINTAQSIYMLQYMDKEKVWSGGGKIWSGDGESMVWGWGKYVWRWGKYGLGMGKVWSGDGEVWSGDVESGGKGMGKVWPGDGEGEMGKLSMCIREPQRRNGAAME